MKDAAEGSIRYPPLHLTLTLNTVIKEKPVQSGLDFVRSPCKHVTNLAEELGLT
jgi:hypothetical protein